MFRLTNLCMAMLFMLFCSACGGGGGGGIPTGTTSYQPASVTLTADKTLATANNTDTITITAVVRDGNGSTLSGQTVNFTVSNGPAPSTTAVTDGNGRASITLTCPAIGSSPYNQIVSVTAESGSASSNSMSVDFADPWAGPRIIVTANGNDTFTVTADTLVDISGIILTLNYDKAVLGSPSVSPGDLASGALFVPNTDTAGIVRVAAISVVGFPSSGTFLALNFTRLGTVSGRIASANAEVFTSGTQSIPVQIIVRN